MVDDLFAERGAADGSGLQRRDCLPQRVRESLGVRLVRIRVRKGEEFERGAWHLGGHYRWIDWVAVLWIAFISIVFLLPVASVGIPGNEGFTWDFVNYTPITVGAAFVLFGGWYVLSAHKWFKGPIRQGTEEELEAIEREYESPGVVGTTTPAR
jgi:hypothetical protein